MRRRDVLQTLGTAVTATTVGTLPTTAAEGTYTDEYYDGLHYTKYVPSGASGGEPLLVMLHGCSQEPDEFAAATGMNDVAERENAVVVYPDQSSFANGFDCWNWYYDYNTARGSGEGASITNVALRAVDRESLDRDRIYLAGFSAGAAMVPNLLASYADVYAAGGVHSGLEYDAAETATGATGVMAFGGPNPYDQGEQAYRSMVDDEIVDRVPTVVVHGTDDDTVDVVNGDQVRTQAVETNDLVDGADDESVNTEPDDRVYDSEGGYDYRRDRYTDSRGRVNVEYWLVEGMGHEWAGGDTGEYVAPDAPSASDALWSFFERWSL
ncbi:PHB depolymerase family esterase [Halobaculum sp. MBLA0147]|uniref:extracellular catalytic domain type 1 short-chain-length polyhydroxyalkanoate depolymerase n=1 Tax=Halobaculum sp. MBLA0147 TaxID=3079934 RepID=UPI0035264DF8